MTVVQLGQRLRAAGRKAGEQVAIPPVVAFAWHS